MEDEDIEILKRKTTNVKADKINDIIMNMDSAQISEQVTNFQQMEEMTVMNDP